MAGIKIIFLGTGTSLGIPVAGCGCKVCCSRDRRNRRHRCSLLIRSTKDNVLVDCCPDFRTQALKHGIDSLAAVLWTHGHADHVHGIDDLRPFGWKTTLQTYGSAKTIASIKSRFPYLWLKKNKKEEKKPRGLIFNMLDESSSVKIGGMDFIPIPVNHGKERIWGWRCDGMAYITDVNEIPESSYKLLEGLDILILGALRFESHHKHFSIQEAVREVEIIKPKHCYLTHISHEASHRKIARITPGNVRPAYDGLILNAGRVWRQA